MMSLMSFMGTFMQQLRKDDGQGMVEYALLIALIAVVVIAGLVVLGPIIQQFFIDISGEL